MTELLDKVIDERDRLRLNYVKLAEKYTNTSWNVVQLSNDFIIIKKKLTEIKEIIESEDSDLIESFYKMKIILDNC